MASTVSHQMDVNQLIHTDSASDDQSISESAEDDDDSSREGRKGRIKKSSRRIMTCCRRDSTTATTDEPRQNLSTTGNQCEYDVDREISELPDIESWEYRPLFLKIGKLKSEKSLPICSPIEFETEMFKGKFMIRIKNAPNTEQGYFEGRRRTKQIVIQGQFKERVSCGKVWMGDTYDKPLNVSSLVHLAVPIFKRLVPGVIMDLFSEKPRVVMLMGGEARTISVDKPGHEPDITGELPERNTERIGIFDSIKHRKKMLRNPAIAAKYEYDNEHIYTFHFYDDIIDIYNYSINLPIGKIPLLHFLNHQPMTFAVVSDDREFFSFRVFHEQLLKQEASEESERQSSMESDQ
jgi:hypothetical protein